MSIEKLIAENTLALMTLVKAIKENGFAKGGVIPPLKEGEEPATVSPKAKPQKQRAAKTETKADGPTKEDVKKKAAELVKAKGAPALKKVLNLFDVKRISDLKPGAGVYEHFLREVEASILGNKEEKSSKEVVEELTGEKVEDMGMEEQCEANDADLLADNPAVPSDEETYTFDDIKALFLKLKDSKGMDKVKGIFETMGTARLSDLQDADYPRAAALIEKEMN